MQPIATDGVAWSVGRSVTIVSPAKTAEPIEMPFGNMDSAGQGTTYWMGVHIVRPQKGNFEGEGAAHCEV